MRRRLSHAIVVLLLVLVPASPNTSLAAEPAKPGPPQSVSAKPATAEPIHITADRIEYFKDTEIYEAEGSVVIVQAQTRLTADKVFIYLLPGLLVATGRAHLTDPTSDLWSERLELNVNTNAGVVTNGRLYVYETNTSVEGRLIQRFSETHFRAKDGSFTNCDAKAGEVPAWRFRFKDADLEMGDRVYLRDAWFCVNDRPLVPVPTFSYPLQSARKTGFLVPMVGYDTIFGFHYRHNFFWAMTPSQDLMITPDYLSKRGYGGDLDYRYVLNRQSRGQWLTSFIQDTKLDKARALLSGSHTQQVDPTLFIRANANYVTDRTYLSDLSMSGVQRALPSYETNLNINKRFTTGSLYFLGQYLQPLQVGGDDTFQRLPEIGHRLGNVTPFGGPVVLGMDTTALHWYRDQGFQLSRVDVLPGLSTDVLNLGHVVGFLPQVKFRETYYTRGVDKEKDVHRETFWAGLEATSRLARQFRSAEGRSLFHTIEPRVIYEYVPPTDQSDIPIIDEVDDLPKKNLLTYSVRNRLLSQKGQGGANNWLDLTIAQSYHLGSTQSFARLFTPLPLLPPSPLVGSPTQPLKPATVPVQGRKFSDVWLKAVIGDPFTGLQKAQALYLTVDTFYDPYAGEVSQFNTDLRWQNRDWWYVDIGQRYTREGNRPRRGDIWNPISFNEVFAPTAELKFVTASGAMRLTSNWSIGARTYYDIVSGKPTESDVVALYQNDCRCWSLGLFYIQFPDRAQYNFVISLTGLGFNESIGSQVLQAILTPLLSQERGLPWYYAPPRRIRAQERPAEPARP